MMREGITVKKEEEKITKRGRIERDEIWKIGKESEKMW